MADQGLHEIRVNRELFTLRVGSLKAPSWRPSWLERAGKLPAPLPLWDKNFSPAPAARTCCRTSPGAMSSSNGRRVYRTLRLSGYNEERRGRDLNPRYGY